MWISKVRTWVSSNRLLAAVIVVLFAAALASAYDSFRHRAMLSDSKKAEKQKAEEIETLKKEGAMQAEAFRSAIGATEPALKSALAGVREAKTSLVQAEAARRELWTPPAVDNLAARFDRAVESLR